MKLAGTIPIREAGHGQFIAELPALAGIKTAGIEQIPILNPPNTVVYPSRLEIFSSWKSATNSEGVVMHFYVDDRKIHSVVLNPMKWTYRLSRASAVISPDLSVYANSPPCVRRYNTRANRTAAAIWQAYGVNVIANVRWNDTSDYEYCFDGCPRQSQIAVSSVSMLRNRWDRRNFIHGYQETLERLEPTSVIWYGAIPRELPRSARESVEILSFPSRSAIAFREKALNGCR